jgi:hypothetical protein
MHDFVATDNGSCNPRFLRSTVNQVPATSTTRDGAGVPLGAAVTPLAKISPREREVATVDFGEMGPPRCHACRVYVNPFVEWKDGGNVWECNFCGADNDTDARYACSVDSYGRRRDRDIRPEVNMGSVDILVPPAMRPMAGDPISKSDDGALHPAVVFAVEVTAASIRTGAADAALDAAVACVRDMPAWPGVRAGVLCYGRSVFLVDSRSGATLGLVEASDIGRGATGSDLRHPVPRDHTVLPKRQPAPPPLSANGASQTALSPDESADDDDDGFCGLGADAWLLPVGGLEADEGSATRARDRFEEVCEHLRSVLVAPHRASLWLPGSTDVPTFPLDDHDTVSPAPHACTGAALATAVYALDTLRGGPGTGCGRVVLFCSSLPRLGMGSLPVRERGALYGGDLEKVLISGPKGDSGLSLVGGTTADPAEKFGLRESRWWTRMALKCAAARVCVDTVMCGDAWMDPAIIGKPSHATGGNMLHYPVFDGPLGHRELKRLAKSPSLARVSSTGAAPPPPSGTGAPPPASSLERGTAEEGATATLPAAGPFALTAISTRLSTELRRIVCDENQGWACSFKVRASAGLKVGTYSCNAYPREGGSEADIACVGSDWTAMVALEYDGTQLQDGDELFIQSALLWTDMLGATRIRVHTLSMRATTDIPTLFRHADIEVVTLYLVHQAIRRVRDQPISSVLDQMKDTACALLYGYRRFCSPGSPPAQLILPESLKILPLLLSCLNKSPALLANPSSMQAAGVDDGGSLTRAVCRATERVAHLHRLRGMSPRQLVAYLYPRVLRLVNMDAKAGFLRDPDVESGRTYIALPDLVWPSSSQLLPEGAWLVEWRDFVLIVLGSKVPDEHAMGMFGKPTADIQDTDELPESKDAEGLTELNERLWAILDELTSQRDGVDIPVGFVTPTSVLRELAVTAMVEDRRDGTLSYADYLCALHGMIQRKVTSAEQQFEY